VVNLPHPDVQLFGKLESMNPLGSVEERLTLGQRPVY
jgi:hypothetical protein